MKNQAIFLWLVVFQVYTNKYTINMRNDIIIIMSENNTTIKVKTNVRDKFKKLAEKENFSSQNQLVEFVINNFDAFKNAETISAENERLSADNETLRNENKKLNKILCNVEYLQEHLQQKETN